MLCVPDDPAVRNLFPQAKPMQTQPLLMVPHGLTETFLLRKLGYQIPSPILTHYDWPGMNKPFEVQRKTCALLTMNPRAYVLNSMGTGKTKSALWAWDYLRSNQACGKLLVVAPLSTLTFVWARELFSTLPHRKYKVLHGTADKRRELLADPDAEIYIVNHDGLKVIAADILACPDIDAMVLDELAVFRNVSDRSKITRKVADKMKWVWGMSGSPMPNKPTDVWMQCKVVTPDTVPKYFGRFREELMIKINQFKYAPKDDAVERAYAVMQPAVRYTLDDVLELPECVERTIDVELGTKQARVYKDIAEKCYAAVQNGEITAVNAGAAVSKLLQVSGGWVYTADGRTVELDNEKRIGALVDNILSADHKVLVFVPFKHALAGISEALKKENIDHEIMSGDTSANRRNEIFNLFQNTNKWKVLAAHPECLCHGVTLTVADTVIWFSPINDLEIYEQACARIRRVGQKNKQLILHLQGTAIERKTYRNLQQKQKWQDKLLDLFETSNQEH